MSPNILLGLATIYFFRTSNNILTGCHMMWVSSRYLIFLVYLLPHKHVRKPSLDIRMREALLVLALCFYINGASICTSIDPFNHLLFQATHPSDRRDK
jgi:hypothetical protein